MKFLKFWWNKFLISTAYIILIGLVYKFSSNETSKIIGTFLTTVFVWVMDKTFLIDYQTKNEKELKGYQGKIDKEMEDYKNEWNQKLEDYKNKLDAELETHKAKLSGYTLVTKLQYDLEFKIYTEIYEEMFNLYIETSKLKPMVDVITTNEDIIKRLEVFTPTYNETSNIINKYRPFYSNEIYSIMLETRDICNEEAAAVHLILQSTSYRFNYMESRKRKDRIKNNLEEISNLIRKRIANMKIVE